MSYDSTIHAKAGELIKLSYEMTAAAGSGHPTSCASLAHLVTVLMYDHMRYEPANPAHPSSDRLVLSEGHAVPVVYAACADLGVAIGKDKGNLRPMTVEDAMTLRAIDSVVDGHPNPVEGFPFFDAATGSLGQGLSVAAGLAAAAKIDALDKRVFCIIGDGESREGQIWEAVDFIKDHELKAVLPIFNCNVYAQSDVVSPQQTPETTAKKLEAAGYKALVIDGHRPGEIQAALNEHAETMSNPNAQPIAIVAKTVKGWGSASQQGDGHHGKPASGDGMAQALEELTATLNDLGAMADTKLSIKLMSPRNAETRDAIAAPSMDEALKGFGMEDVLSKGKLATRRAYGVALRALGQARADVVALDADVKNSTFAEMFSKDESLASRFLECRIAEQNMFSVAAGLSAAGKTAYTSTFAKFVARGYDQIEMAINSGANFKVVGSHAGISLAADGPSQMSLPDIAWFRSFATMTRPNGLPGCYVLQPSCAYQAYALTMAMADFDGVCYMRTLRPDMEFLYSANDTFTLGGHEVLSQGRDLLIVATGYMVHQANKALEELDKQGIDATLVDLYSIPFDSDAILDLANANNGNILTLEDNYGAGAGSAIADAASADGGGFTVQQMHVRNLPKSGRTTEDVMAYCGLSVNDIVKGAMSMLELSTA
ncbi:transketolase [Mucisphaera calidilacus]|uniref:Transketolase 1 n=1 Tax=Mucisphaera calidilacus TaxID=2527982 RepID=A0A518BVF6_9BACT|nr:transketolase [Mucisphaera calidilacus]QDU70956.1 Transketolase 1 [Mucisphaera calidilacus]